MKALFKKISFWLCWVFVTACGLSLVAVFRLIAVASLVAVQSVGAGSAAVAPWRSCCVACGLFPDQGSNLCPLHLQVDS